MDFDKGSTARKSSLKIQGKVRTDPNTNSNKLKTMRHSKKLDIPETVWEVEY